MPTLSLYFPTETSINQTIFLAFEQKNPSATTLNYGLWQDIQKMAKLAFSHQKDFALNIRIGDILRRGGLDLQVTGIYTMPCSNLPIFHLQKVEKRAVHDKNTKEMTEEATSLIANDKERLDFEHIKKGFSLAVITLSDKGFIGQRVDESGPQLQKIIAETLDLQKNSLFLIPDEPEALRALVSNLALNQGYDCIITCGGTGLSPRDRTAEAVLPLLDRRLQGFEIAMMQESLKKTPHAMLSQAFCGILGKTIVIAVPGSMKASSENIQAITPALKHALDKLHGDMSDCGKRS